MKKTLVIFLILLGCGLACPYADVSAADDTKQQKEPYIDPGAEDYWNMMAEKDRKEAEKDKAGQNTQSGTSTADRVKNSPSYTVPSIDKKGAYGHCK